VAPSHHVTVASQDFVRSAQTNDHSNPQQGTGAMKATVQMKKDSVQQGKKERHPAATKHIAPPSSSYVEDKRKLFVGGLPTDITDPEFRAFFSQFGELHESVVMFDRETRRSRGFGFVTYVNPEVSKSLLQMGDHGDGVGRLVMRGKTCEVKAAAPKGHAPTRGGKANRGNRGGPRNQYQAQAHQTSPFVHTEQFPDMYYNDSYNMSYPQGVYSSAPGVSGYNTPMYHPIMPHYAPPPPHGPFLLPTDHDPRGAPYFFAPPPADRFSVPDAFPPTHQLLANFPQHAYEFIPLVPGFPVTEMPYMMQHVEPEIQVTEEIYGNDEGVIEIEKE